MQSTSRQHEESTNVRKSVVVAEHARDSVVAAHAANAGDQRGHWYEVVHATSCESRAAVHASVQSWAAAVGLPQTSFRRSMSQTLTVGSAAHDPSCAASGASASWLAELMSLEQVAQVVLKPS